MNLFLRIFLAVVIVPFLTFCNNSTSPSPEPTSGTLKVITATGGEDLDAEYTVTVDGQSLTVSSNDTIRVDLSKGTYSTELSDINANCESSSNNPDNVIITLGDTTETKFDIDCKKMIRNKIVFSSDRMSNDNDRDIFIMNADGANPTRLTTSTYTDEFPTISNDGTQIAFHSYRNTGSYNVYIMDADQTNLRKVTNIESHVYGAISFSPDDSKLVFKSNHEGDMEIYSINVDGSGLTNLTNHPAIDESPEWSPNGNRILFESYRSGEKQLHTMNPDGTGVKQLTTTSFTEAAETPSWSPDGEKIAFSGYRNGQQDIYTMNKDGAGITQITNNPGLNINPAWSADGTEIIFTTDRDGQAEIYKVNAGGSGIPTNMTASQAADVSANWSPVGS
ncbi:DUF5050 domain-containing protein [Fodinibius halophilus]|uniref:DUF5050 domain-containing protein n=1 Tax=Fodinibius halophilus TaxID=1736908 RepID=A0A6M1T661_9BACT|nr:DUF5050 domain-containing protein [Fodinibius halophilus]NGP88775.1 hypothetical protein [Fodinibius halophilus]